MNRLTTSKDVKDMNVCDLLHNCCYVKDELARYRDYQTDIDARDLVRKLMVKYGDWKSIISNGLEANNELIDDDIFDETMLENLMYEPTEIQGLIARFYSNVWAMAELRERLKTYEDAEEQGLLLKMPCKIGDDVYIIPSKVNFKLNILSKHEENNRIYHQKVERITFTRNGWYLECDKDVEYGTDRIRVDRFFGETWFLSEEEAEQALQGMKEGV